MNARIFLAFDFGEKRIGIAVGNDIAESANALTTIVASNDDERFTAIGPIVKDWQPTMLIVGYPSHPDGAPHEMSARAERFARQLEGRFRTPVQLVDERYSSAEAELTLARERGRKPKDKLAIDAEAAANILRRFFDSGAHRNPMVDTKASVNS